MTNQTHAEQAVVGAILIDPTCLRDVSRSLTPEDFGMEANRVLYEAALSLSAKGRAVDPVTIAAESQRMGAAIPQEYLLQLMDTTPTAANVMEYVPIVRRNALRRQIGALAAEVTEQVNAGNDPQDILADLLSRAGGMEQEGTHKTLLSPMDLALRWFDHREKVESGKSAAFVPTGYRDLDLILGGGLIASGMHVLAARPGMGKTTFALNIADRVAKTVGPVLFVSLEMDDEQITAKRLARETAIPGSRLLMKRLTEEENQKQADATDRLLMTPLHINAKPSATVAEIATMARQVQGLKLIVIDYMGKIGWKKGSGNMSLYEATTQTSADVKTLARTFKVPVLVLSQINREAEKRADKRPNLSDLRDTGAIEQDADTVMFLYRKDYYGRDQDRDPYMPDDTDCIIAKNRHAGTGECRFAFFPAVSKFVTAESDPRTAFRKAVQTGEA